MSLAPCLWLKLDSFPGHLRYPPEINYHLYVADSHVYTSNSNFPCGIKSLMLSCQPRVSTWTCRTGFITSFLASTKPLLLLYFLSQFTYWDMASIFSRPEISSWFPSLTHPTWGQSRTPDFLGLASSHHSYHHCLYISFHHLRLTHWYSNFCLSPSL